MQGTFEFEQFQKSLETYESLWEETQDLSPEDLQAYETELVNFSVDLTEATYNIPFKVIEVNRDFLDDLMPDFVPWNTFRDLFRIHPRDVDMTQLIDDGFFSGPEIVRSTRGTFMGDGLSFIDLTLLLGGMLRAVTYAIDEPRPLGQSVGDDLFLMKAKYKTCTKFCCLAELLGCKFSKLNSISEDSATFCEQYFANVHDLHIYKPLAGFKDSVFGDCLFLDTIKGSILSGQSKVKTSGQSPFIGHSNMLNKQVRWHPLHTVKENSKILLWASNYMEAIGMGTSMSSLPHQLGGMELAVGQTLTYYDDKFYHGMLPYYEAMLRLELEDFFKYYILLQGVFKANPKGFAWQNDWEVVRQVIENCDLVKISNLDDVVPDHVKQKSYFAKLKYLNRERGLIPFHDLASELARRDAFHKMWNNIRPPSFMTLKVKDARKRTNHAWAIIKSGLVKVESEYFLSSSIQDLADRFKVKTLGFYISREDPAISAAFEGTPSLYTEILPNGED